MKQPRLIPGDKANHRVRGSNVAAVCACIALLAGVLAFGPKVAVILTAAAVAQLAAYLAGELVERWQSRINAEAMADDRPPPHSIERADVYATARGGLPVALPLLVLALLAGLS
jgi:hypothetical protein